MKLVILAGGNKSVISEEREGIPKPMLEIAGRPLLWHIMKYASFYGIKDFVICGGYKINRIKEYFKDFYVYQSDLEIDLRNNQIRILKKQTEDWKVTVVDTGLRQMPAKRICAAAPYLQDEAFLTTYGDCLSNISIDRMIAQHYMEKNKVTMAAAHPTGRKMALDIPEKAWTSAGMFLMEPSVFDGLNQDGDIEEILMADFKQRGELGIFRHEGAWMAIETVRDKAAAEKLWEQGKAFWVANE